MIRLTSGAATDVGRVRTINEDSYLEAEGLFAVADGMGGHRGGEVASADALNSFRTAILEPNLDQLVGAVLVANRSVFERSLHDPELSGMGTTLCAIALVREPIAADRDGADGGATGGGGANGDGGEVERIAVVNVGDSRVYLLHDAQFVQLSEDHSLVEEMVRDGQLTPDEAADHPRRNVLTRALGVDPTVLVDSWTVEPRVGDRFLLCSDGLFNELHDDQISAVLRRLGDPGEAARELVRLASEAGGRDNITVVIVDVSADAGGEIDGANHGAGAVIGTRVIRNADATDDPAGFASTWEATESTGFDDDSPQPTNMGRTHSRGSRWRTAVFVVAVLGVFGLAFAAIAYTARSTYFVTSDDGEVVIKRGRRDQLLWFRPTIAERTGIAMSDLTGYQRDRIERETEQPDLATARRQVALLREALEIQSAATTTTTSPTTAVPTTTLAPAGPVVTSPPGAP